MLLFQKWLHLENHPYCFWVVGEGRRWMSGEGLLVDWWSKIRTYLDLKEIIQFNTLNLCLCPREAVCPEWSSFSCGKPDNRFLVWYLFPCYLKKKKKKFPPNSWTACYLKCLLRNFVKERNDVNSELSSSTVIGMESNNILCFIVIFRTKSPCPGWLLGLLLTGPVWLGSLAA